MKVKSLNQFLDMSAVQKQFHRKSKSEDADDMEHYSDKEKLGRVTKMWSIYEEPTNRPDAAMAKPLD